MGHSIKRREFLNLIVKSIGAAGFIKVYGGGAPLALAEQGEAKKVAATPPPEIWVEEKMVVNKSSGVVHWPHPKVFKHRYRVAPQNSKTIEVSDWRETVAKDPDVNFNKGKSGTIYEHLALREIEIEDEETLTFNDESLNESIEILKVAVKEPGNSQNWRLYELLGRLVSLKNEDDPEAARTEFIGILEASEISEDWKQREPLTRAQDKEKFSKWHAKTVDTKHGDHRKKLIARVQSSKEL